MKTKYIFPKGTTAQGWIAVVKSHSHVSTQAIALAGDSTNWHSVSLLDTLSLLSTDSVIIKLSGGASDTSAHGNPMWFDDVTFKKLP
ncbi:MAG: hypothetical protein ACHQM6_11175 [Candidatus Kapaibacterium sp.]